MLPRLARTASRLARNIPDALFAAVFLIFLYKIVLRYALHEAPAWSDEICVILFVWMVFCANAFVLDNRAQISFDLLYRPMPAALRRVMAALRLALVGGIFAAALPTIVDYILFLRRERTPVLQWRLDLVYSCFALFAVCVVLRSAMGLLRLAGRGWRRAL